MTQEQWDAYVQKRWDTLVAIGQSAAERRAELIDDIAEKLWDTCDLDVKWTDYAEAVVEMLEKRGMLRLERHA